MSEDYLIGFIRPPLDLEQFLLSRGFRLESTHQRPGEILLTNYHLFVDRKSARGLWLSYFDGVEADDRDLWQKIAPEAPIVSTASLSTPMGRNWFDKAGWRQTAADIRDRYSALLFEPQAARFVYHEDSLGDEAQIVKHPIEYRDWFASQWSSTSVAIYSGSQPQPARILERPEGWGANWSWNLYDKGIYFKRT